MDKIVYHEIIDESDRVVGGRITESSPINRGNEIERQIKIMLDRRLHGMSGVGEYLRVVANDGTVQTAKTTFSRIAKRYGWMPKCEGERDRNGNAVEGYAYCYLTRQYTRKEILEQRNILEKKVASLQSSVNRYRNSR